MSHISSILIKAADKLELLNLNTVKMAQLSMDPSQ